MMNEKQFAMQKAAHRLFKEKSYVETSIADIVKESNVSRGTFYNYFASKAALLVEITRSFQEHLKEERTLLTVQHRGTDEELLREVIYLCREKEQNSRINQIVAEAAGEKDIDLVRYAEDLRINRMQWLHVYVKRAFGSTYPHATLAATQFVESTLNYHISFNRIVNKPRTLREIVDYCVDLMIFALPKLEEKPLFSTDDFLFDDQMTCKERFTEAADQLIQWLLTHEVDNAMLLKEYIELLLSHRELPLTNPALTAHIKKQLVEALNPDYPAIHNFVKLIG